MGDLTWISAVWCAERERLERRIDAACKQIRFPTSSELESGLPNASRCNSQPLHMCELQTISVGCRSF